MTASIPAFAQRHLPLGLQLYTVRADLAKDYEGTLKQVKAAGVRKVQANLTMSGKSSKDQRKLYDSLGLTWDSVHAGGDGLRDTAQATIDEAKAAGIAQVCFAKKCGLTVEDMTGSQRVYDSLRRFRAGIEGGISYLKRVFGMGRCTSRGRCPLPATSGAPSWPLTC